MTLSPSFTSALVCFFFSKEKKRKLQTELEALTERTEVISPRRVLHFALDV